MLYSLKRRLKMNGNDLSANNLVMESNDTEVSPTLEKHDLPNVHVPITQSQDVSNLNQPMGFGSLYKEQGPVMIELKRELYCLEIHMNYLREFNMYNAYTSSIQQYHNIIYDKMMHIIKNIFYFTNEAFKSCNLKLENFDEQSNRIEEKVLSSYVEPANNSSEMDILDLSIKTKDPLNQDKIRDENELKDKYFNAIYDTNIRMEKCTAEMNNLKTMQNILLSNHRIDLQVFEDKNASIKQCQLLEKELANMKIQNSYLAQQIKSENDKYNEISKQNIVLKNELIHIKTSHDEEIKRLNTSKKISEQLNEELKEQNLKLKENNVELENNIEDKENQLKKLRTSYDNILKKEKDLTENLECKKQSECQNQDEIINLKQEVEKKYETIVHLQKENEKLNAGVNSARRKIYYYMKLNAKLEKSNNQLKFKLRVAEMHIREAKNGIKESETILISDGESDITVDNANPIGSKAAQDISNTKRKSPVNTDDNVKGKVPKK